MSIYFDTSIRRWALEGDVSSKLPDFEGEILIDDATRQSMATDHGAVVSHAPGAVLRPRTHADVALALKFAHEHRIAVTVRGQGHSVFGQAQSDGGLVIDTASLKTIHEIGDDYAIVDAGCTWGELLQAGLAASPPRRPPVITGFSHLSIGGTLSVGGLSGMSCEIGCQVQHVSELRVVTGKGDIVTCSEQQERELFLAVLAGQGQCGAIVQAKITLVPAKPRTVDFTIIYPRLEQMLDAMNVLLDSRRGLDLVWGGASPTPMGLAFPLFVNKHYDPATDEAPAAEKLLEGVHLPPSPPGMPPMPMVADQTFMEYVKKIDQQVLDIPTGGGRRALWLDVFIGRDTIASYAQEVFDNLGDDDMGAGGLVLFFPIPVASNTRPLLRFPESDYAFLFDFFRNTNPIDEPKVEELLARNRRLYEEAVRRGGKIYPIGAIPMTAADWKVHYGDAWDGFLRAKEKYDPARILGRGVAIFGDSA